MSKPTPRPAQSSRSFMPVRPVSTSDLRLEDLSQDEAAGGAPKCTPPHSSLALPKRAASQPLALRKVRPSDSGASGAPTQGAVESDGAISPCPTVRHEDTGMDSGMNRDADNGSHSQDRAGEGGAAGGFTFRMHRNSKAAASMRTLFEGDEDDEAEQARPWRRASKRKTGISKVKALDAFAFKEKPHTIAGGVMTVAIAMAVVAYTVYIVLAYMNRPWTTTPVNQWTYNSGPWPLRLRCRAASGCYLSNHVTQRWSSLTPDPAQSECAYLAPGEWATASLLFSNNPNEGLGVIFVPGPSNTTLLPAGSEPRSPEALPGNFGFEIESTMLCPPGYTDCEDGTMTLRTPVGGGLSLLSLVETTNHSATGVGLFRREWYPTQVANFHNRPAVAVVPAATACDAARFNDSWVHARVRVNAQYVQVTVDRSSLWLVVWGAVGGALGLFMQVGGLLLGAASLLLGQLGRRPAPARPGAAVAPADTAVAATGTSADKQAAAAGTGRVGYPPAGRAISVSGASVGAGPAGRDGKPVSAQAGPVQAFLAAEGSGASVSLSAASTSSVDGCVVVLSVPGQAQAGSPKQGSK